MNIAYLDPPFTRHFQHLAHRVAERTGGEAAALLTSPAFAPYCGSHRREVWQAGATAAVDATLPLGFDRLPWARRDDPAFRRVFGEAVAWLRERFEQLQTDLCMVFSDARPFSQAAAVAARDCGVVCLYLERGAFRLATSSLSVLGLNARFNLSRAAELQQRIEGMAPDDSLHKRDVEPWLRTRFAGFIARQWTALSGDDARRSLQHKEYEFANYAHVALTQWQREHRPPARVDPHRSADEPLVVVVLQLESDSQMVLHSPFNDNQVLLDTVARDVAAVSPKARVVFKTHPMDARRYRAPAGVQRVDGNLGRFFDDDAIFVCVNSTVGFEAACHGTRTLCFGPSFYTDASAVMRATPADFRDRFAQVVESAPDAAAGRALRDAVLRWYQVPGDAWAYTDDDIERSAKIVLQHHAAARAVADARVVRPAFSAKAIGARGRAIA
jgi:capsular polysaccharide export protein